jgi:hypothetical protein
MYNNVFLTAPCTYQISKANMMMPGKPTIYPSITESHLWLQHCSPGGEMALRTVAPFQIFGIPKR